MIQEFNGKKPKIARSAYIHNSAIVIGDVEIGENSSVWPGAVIRADFAPIKIGNNALIEDCCVLHAAEPMEIGDNTVLGHGVLMHAKKVGNCVQVGMGSILLQFSEVGDDSVIGAGCLVVQGMKVPENSLVMGVPGRIVGRPKDEQKLWVTAGVALYTELARKYRESGL